MGQTKTEPVITYETWVLTEDGYKRIITHTLKDALYLRKNLK